MSISVFQLSVSLFLRRTSTSVMRLKSNSYLHKIDQLKATIPEWDTFFGDKVSPEKTVTKSANEKADNCENDEAVSVRACNWVRLEVLGEPLCKKYAWAIPDERALQILASFSPLIEIGAGRGYWARLLRDQGVDILAFDKYRYNCDSASVSSSQLSPSDELPRVLNDFVHNGKMWTTVISGGPSSCSPEVFMKYTAVDGNDQIAQAQDGINRNLFLCYPDDTEEMSTKCLQYFKGEFIIHVGELFSTGTLSGAPQNPFGRTTSSSFSVRLAEQFHCVLSARIPRFPFSNDCITVWKRTNYVRGRGINDFWADIPVDERMPVDIAAPIFEHLLQEKKRTNKYAPDLDALLTDTMLCVL